MKSSIPSILSRQRNLYLFLSRVEIAIWWNSNIFPSVIDDKIISVCLHRGRQGIRNDTETKKNHIADYLTWRAKVKFTGIYDWCAHNSAEKFISIIEMIQLKSQCRSETSTSHTTIERCKWTRDKTAVELALGQFFAVKKNKQYFAWCVSVSFTIWISVVFSSFIEILLTHKVTQRLKRRYYWKVRVLNNNRDTRCQLNTTHCQVQIQLRAL